MLSGFSLRMKPEIQALHQAARSLHRRIGPFVNIKKYFYRRGTDTGRNGDAHRRLHTVGVAPTACFSEITADIIVALRPNEKDLEILGLYHKVIEAVPGLDKQVE